MLKKSTVFPREVSAYYQNNMVNFSAQQPFQTLIELKVTQNFSEIESLSFGQNVKRGPRIC